jgi:hypothetical protein
MTYSIYVSGPIMAPDIDGGLPSRLTVERRKMKFNQVSKIIRDNVGSATLVINPLDIEACKLGTTGPVCGGVEDGKHSWQCYLRYDLEQLVMCHEIVMLPGWSGSPGAKVEKSVAEMLGLLINYWCDKHISAHPSPCTEEECQGA